jgi:hypothetical protein
MRTATSRSEEEFFGGKVDFSRTDRRIRVRSWEKFLWKCSPRVAYSLLLLAYVSALSRFPHHHAANRTRADRR